MKWAAPLLAVAVAGGSLLAAFASAAGTAGPAPDTTLEPSCFGDRIDHPQAAKIARNTVFIAEVRTDGTLISAATGFVVKGASGPRIVTARHVIEPGGAGPPSAFMVFFSNGLPLGFPRVMAAGAEQKISIADVNLVVNDLAILQISQFSNASARDSFADLDGLPVRAGGRVMAGETSGPTGVIWGYSGAPAVDREGQVVGVLTGADFRGRTPLSLGIIQGANAEDRLRGVEVTLPSRSVVVVEPFHDPAIVKELNLTAASGNGGEETPVVFAGFPYASCASTSARLQAADSKEGANLLKKWDSIGQVGAWWLQPPLSIKKLKLAPE